MFPILYNGKDGFGTRNRLSLETDSTRAETDKKQKLTQILINTYENHVFTSFYIEIDTPDR